LDFVFEDFDLESVDLARTDLDSVEFARTAFDLIHVLLTGCFLVTMGFEEGLYLSFVCIIGLSLMALSVKPFNCFGGLGDR